MEKGRVSAKAGAILAWGLGFILAETIGVIVNLGATGDGLGVIPAAGLASLATVAFRFAVLSMLPAITGLRLRNAVYFPGLRLKQLRIVLLGVIIVSLSSYLENSFSVPLMGISYFLESGAAWAFAAQVLYYFSEVVVMNYMYILASNGWRWRRGPISSGTLFLILGWALLHAITKSAEVAVYGIILVVILYAGYEYTGSPLTPIILWFVELIV